MIQKLRLWFNAYFRKLMHLPEYEYQRWFLNSAGATRIGNWSLTDLTRDGWEFDRIEPINYNGTGIDSETLVLRRKKR